MNADELRRLPSLGAYTDDELALLASVSVERALAPGAFLCREGTTGQSCFVVVRGEVEVVKAMGGAERVLAKLGPGAMVGQMALLDRAPRSASLRARTQALAIELSRDVFERLLRSQSPLALRFQHQIAVAGIHQLRAALDRMALLRSKPAPRASAPPPSSANATAEQRKHALACVQAATNDWDITLEDMDAAEFVVPDGMMSQAELAARRGRRG